MGDAAKKPGAAISVSPDESKQVDLLIQLARDEMAEAFRASDVLEAKAKSSQQVSTVFFGASQAAVAALAASSSARVPLGVALAAGLIAVLALVATALGAFMVIQLHETTKQRALDLDRIKADLLGPAERDRPGVPRLVYSTLAFVVKKRREDNDTKGTLVARAQNAAYAGLVLSALEVAFAIGYAVATR